MKLQTADYFWNDNGDAVIVVEPWWSNLIDEVLMRRLDHEWGCSIAETNQEIARIVEEWGGRLTKPERFYTIEFENEKSAALFLLRWS